MRVALGIFLVGALLVWLGVMPVLSGLDVCLDFAAQPEGSSSSSGPSLSPPGTIVCEYRAPSGDVTRETYVPWFEWLVLAIVAAGIGLVSVLLRRRRRA